MAFSSVEEEEGCGDGGGGDIMNRGLRLTEIGGEYADVSDLDLACTPNHRQKTHLTMWRRDRARELPTTKASRGAALCSLWESACY